MPTPADLTPILPGATLGVLGSGQLGRMFALAAKAMGYRVHTFSPERDTPTGQVADKEIVAAYEDLEAVEAFAKEVAAVTFEFENVPFATTEAAAKHAPVRPGGHVLHTTQHRLREKTFLSTHGFPLAGYARITSEQDLIEALKKLGTPAILKTAGWGYDGKGQIKITDPAQAPQALRTLTATAQPIAPTQPNAPTHPNAPTPTPMFAGSLASRSPTPHPNAPTTPTGLASPLAGCLPPTVPASLPPFEAVLEAFVPFAHEASVVCARKARGEFTHWGLIENLHVHHILDLSISPARLPESVHKSAIDIARHVVEQLNVVGILCVEFFVKPDGSLLINELAPRPHNSGHLTIDASPTSQFEQQVRTLCNLPLGDTTPTSPSAMAQLLGDAWSNTEPNWPAALQNPRTKLHLYGKAEARPGRKMGHLTTTASTAAQAASEVLEARSRLCSR